MLLAPVAGCAVVLLTVFWLNRLGVPATRFGVILTLVLLAASAVALWRLRPAVAWRSYLPFAAVLAVALIVVGWPLFEYGFDWIAFANDDMANYTLMAERYLNHGFSD